MLNLTSLRKSVVRRHSHTRLPSRDTAQRLEEHIGRSESLRRCVKKNSRTDRPARESRALNRATPVARLVRWPSGGAPFGNQMWASKEIV